LFSDVNVNNYGRKIYDYLKDNSDKDVYYADGNTKSDAREYIKQRMEEDTTGNTVFVGSTGCFSEGIDVGNLWYIILANSVKSQYIVRQFIGRGMRRFPGKDKVVIFDIVDDLRYAHRFDKDSLKNNYMWKHHLERNKIYREQKFPVYEMKVDYKNQKLF
jgi:superfamily II DNA or RNA helicase